MGRHNQFVRAAVATVKIYHYPRPSRYKPEGSALKTMARVLREELEQEAAANLSDLINSGSEDSQLFLRRLAEEVYGVTVPVPGICGPLERGR